MRPTTFQRAAGRVKARVPTATVVQPGDFHPIAPVAPAQGTQADSLFEAPTTDEHSEKPAFIHEMIERLWPNTAKLEMFARASRPGWDVWGAEAPDGDLPTDAAAA